CDGSQFREPRNSLLQIRLLLADIRTQRKIDRLLHERMVTNQDGGSTGSLDETGEGLHHAVTRLLSIQRRARFVASLREFTGRREVALISIRQPKHPGSR